MRVIVTIDPRDPRRDSVREDAEWWLGNMARSGWRVGEDEDSDDGRVLRFEFDDPGDAWAFHLRAANAEHRGRID